MGWVARVLGEVGWGGDGVSYQCLKLMVLGVCGELPFFEMQGVKSLW